MGITSWHPDRKGEKGSPPSPPMAPVAQGAALEAAQRAFEAREAEMPGRQMAVGCRSERKTALEGDYRLHIPYTSSFLLLITG